MPASLVLDDTAVAYLIGVAIARASGLQYGPVVCPGEQVFGGRMVICNRRLARISRLVEQVP
jgi:hypothetical protein